MNAIEPRESIRLLLVDDEVEFLESTSRALSRRGFDVVTAEDAITALKRLEQERFDVAVLDVLMPGMSGDDLFRRIRRLHPKLPVIMLTGHGTVQQAFQVSREGVFDYLTKPCDIDAVARVVLKAVLGTRGPTSATDLDSEREIRLLIVDDEVEFLESLSTAMRRRGMHVFTASSGDEAIELLNQQIFDVAVLDIRLPDTDGIGLLYRAREAQPPPEVILLTGHPSAETGVEGIQGGAFFYMTKPCRIEDLALKIREAHAAVRANREAERKRSLDRLLSDRNE